jgi:hypothetical protein
MSGEDGHAARAPLAAGRAGVPSRPAVVLRGRLFVAPLPLRQIRDTADTGRRHPRARL